MHCVFEMPVAQIARDLAINPNTAYTLLRAARGDVQAALKRLKAEKRAALRAFPFILRLDSEVAEGQADQARTDPDWPDRQDEIAAPPRRRPGLGTSHVVVSTQRLVAAGTLLVVLGAGVGAGLVELLRPELRVVPARITHGGGATPGEFGPAGLAPSGATAARFPPPAAFAGSGAATNSSGEPPAMGAADRSSAPPPAPPSAAPSTTQATAQAAAQATAQATATAKAAAPAAQAKARSGPGQAGAGDVVHDNFREEQELIRAAYAALLAQDHDAALTNLNHHEAQFVQSRFAGERRELRRRALSGKARAATSSAVKPPP